MINICQGGYRLMAKFTAFQAVAVGSNPTTRKEAKVLLCQFISLAYLIF